MGEIINLRKARKRRGLEKAGVVAAANRIAFGTPKSVRETAAALRVLDRNRLDAHKRAGPDDDD
ncbi:MAG: DUF4169 family protein [Roseiarcus sp.]|jgi:uncharacterized protein DUF4169